MKRGGGRRIDGDMEKNANTGKLTKGNQFYIKITCAFRRLQILFYRSERREVLGRRCFMAVDFFDLVWLLLTFIRREDETKKLSPDDVPSSGLLCSYGDVERFCICRMIYLRGWDEFDGCSSDVSGV